MELQDQLAAQSLEMEFDLTGFLWPSEKSRLSFSCLLLVEGIVCWRQVTDASMVVATALEATVDKAIGFQYPQQC